MYHIIQQYDLYSDYHHGVLALFLSTIYAINIFNAKRWIQYCPNIINIISRTVYIKQRNKAKNQLGLENNQN